MLVNIRPSLTAIHQALVTARATDECLGYDEHLSIRCTQALRSWDLPSRGLTTNKTARIKTKHVWLMTTLVYNSLDRDVLHAVAITASLVVNTANDMFWCHSILRSLMHSMLSKTCTCVMVLLSYKMADIDRSLVYVVHHTVKFGQRAGVVNMLHCLNIAAITYFVVWESMSFVKCRSGPVPSESGSTMTNGVGDWLID